MRTVTAVQVHFKFIARISGAKFCSKEAANGSVIVMSPESVTSVAY